MTEQQRAQEQDALKAAAAARRKAQTEKFDAVLAAIHAALADLTLSPIERGRFHVEGEVHVATDHGPSYGYSRNPLPPDRITVRYTERTGSWRRQHKTLTYTNLDVSRIAGRVREVAARVAQSRAVAERAEAEETAARNAREAKLAPMEREVAAFNNITGTRRFNVAVSPSRHGNGLTLSLTPESPDDVVVVLQALLQHVIKTGGGQ